MRQDQRVATAVITAKFCAQWMQKMACTWRRQFSLSLRNIDGQVYYKEFSLCILLAGE